MKIVSRRRTPLTFICGLQSGGSSSNYLLRYYARKYLLLPFTIILYISTYPLACWPTKPANTSCLAEWTAKALRLKFASAWKWSPLQVVQVARRQPFSCLRAFKPVGRINWKIVSKTFSLYITVVCRCMSLYHE